MKISELPLANSVSATDDVPIDRSGVTYRVHYEALRGPAGQDGADGADGTIENLVAAATTLSPGSNATASYSGNTLTLGIPRGATGATGRGISSIAKTSTSGAVDTYTITYTDGTTSTFNVTNGGGSITVDTAMSNSSTNPVQNAVITAVLANKADASDTYTKAQVDAKIEKPVPKTLTFSSENWSASTWSASAVDAGATSGGLCYVATYSSSGITLYNRFIPEHAKGYTGAVYVTPVSGGFRVETATQPTSSNEISGVAVNTDVYVANGVAAVILGDPIGASDVYTKAQVNAKFSYSTTATPTGGTWIDGKPIYRQVLSNTLSNTAETKVIGTISDFGFLVSARFIMVGSNFYTDGATYSGTTVSKLGVGVVQDSGNVVYKSYESVYYGNTIYAIVEFTKSTD